MTARVAARPAVRQAATERAGTSRADPGWLVWTTRGVLSLTLGYALVAMPLAMLGRFRPLLVGGGTAAATVALLALWSRARAGREPTAHAPAVAVVMLVAALTALNVAYSSEHLLTERDPGIYVVTGLYLADRGELLAPGLQGPFARFDGLELEAGFYPGAPGGRLYPQFLHLLPAVLAAGAWLGDTALLLKVNALVGGVALLAFHAFCRRLLRPWFAVAATAALGVNLVQVHFTRDAYTEILTQVFLFGGLWALDDWRRNATPALGVLAGLLLGATCMTRIDALVYLIPLIAVLTIEALRSRRVASVAAGLAIPVGLGLLDGLMFSPPYLADLAGSLVPLAAGLMGTIVAGALLVRARTPIVRLARRAAGAQRALAAGAAALVVCGGVYAWAVRPAVAVDLDAQQPNPAIAAMQEAEGVPVDQRRTYAEQTFPRLASYLGPVALAAAIAGMALASYRLLAHDEDRYEAFLAVFSATLVLYSWQPSITPDQIWALRRFLPTVLPGLVALALLACQALAGDRRRWRQGAATLGVVAILAHPLAVLAPLLDTRTQGSVLAAVDRLCAEIGQDAAVLVQAGLLGLVLPHTIQASCQTPVAVGVIEEERVRALADQWREEGRRLVVVSRAGNSLAGPWAPQAQIDMEWELLERTVERRPSRTITEDLTVVVTPVP